MRESIQDIARILSIIGERNGPFEKSLGHSERRLVSELRDIRNRWAHQEPFSSDDTYRALDSASRLLNAVHATEASEIEKMKQELLRLRFDEQNGPEKRKAPDVVSVRTQQAAPARPTTQEGECRCCAAGLPTEGERICPECRHEFKFGSWGGIDAHWRSKHKSIMPYEQFRDSLCKAHRGKRR